MKRFYCTVCKRIKRVRKYPTSVQQVASEDVMQRVGTCTRHSNPSFAEFKRRNLVGHDTITVSTKVGQ